MGFDEHLDDGRRWGRVIVAVLLVVLLGIGAAATLDRDPHVDPVKRQPVKAATATMQEVDATLDSTHDRRALAEFPDAGTASVTEGPTVSVSINGTDGCTATVDLQSIAYRLDDRNATVQYAGGAVWRRVDGERTLVEPPIAGYDDGTVRLQLPDVTGRVARRTNLTRRLERSYDRTEAIDERLSECGLGPGGTVRIEVASDAPGLWERHLSEAFPGRESVIRSGDVVVVRVLTEDVDTLSIRYEVHVASPAEEAG